MNGLALCAGVDGIGLGLGIAIPSYRTICAVEREASAAAILVARQKDGSLHPFPIWDCLSTFDGKPWRGAVDIIHAGIPCQPWSVAGKQLKTEDERWIWPDVLRIIREVEPEFVFLEEVWGFVRGGLGLVIRDLAGIGYMGEYDVLRASDVGAPHQRKRVFIMAHSRGSQWGQDYQMRRVYADVPASGRDLAHSPLGGLGVRGKSSGGGGLADGAKQDVGNAQPGDDWRGQSDGASFIEGSGVAPAAPSSRCCPLADPRHRLLPQPRRGPQGRDGARSAGEDILGDAHQPGPQGWRCDDGGCGDERFAWAGSLPLFPPGPADRDGWAAILPEWPWLAPAVESGVRCDADGLAVVVDAARADQLRAIGNGVVALQGAAAFITLARRAGLDFWGGR